MSFFTVTDMMGLEDLEARCRRAISEMPKLVQTALGELGTEMVKALSEATPVGIGRTGGHLADSYSSEVTADAVVIRTSQMQKLTWVRYGTGVYGKFSHPIVPTTRPAMWWPEAAHPYTSVRGQHAHDFVTPVLDNTQQYLDEVLQPFAEQLLTILDGG